MVESWTGELQPGNRVVVPELKPAPGAMPISLNPKRTDLRQHVGSRMVLFLKREKGSEASPTPANIESGEKWRPADFSNEMKTSVVWMDGGYVYGFQQVMNPGLSVLTRLDTSLQKMKDRVTEINRVHEELVEVVGIGNSGARAQGLKPYVRSEMYEAQRLALNELGKCGPAAVETIRGMLNDPAFGDEAAELVKAFVEAGGEAVGEELTSRLQQELAFWQATAPSLSQGWWNQDPVGSWARTHALHPGVNHGKEPW